jgi:ABC-2 type transport system ATP-binding protein
MAQDAPPIVLQATELTRRYSDLVAVDRLSLGIRRGEILGFLGPNGAGKTTTLTMLCGLLKPDSGRIEIDGDPIEAVAGRQMGRPTTGVAPQSTAIWETLTPFEQLSFMGQMYDLAPSAARRRADTLISVFGLEEKRNRPGRTLSGGMQRRLNIALALVHEPEILFLDEPQAGLDPQSRVLARDDIRSLAGPTTIIITTHDMDEAERLSDRVCIIDHGRLLALDSVRRIKDQLGEGDLFEIEAGPELWAGLKPLIERLERDKRDVSQRGSVLRFASEDWGEILSEVFQTAKHLIKEVDRRTMSRLMLSRLRTTGFLAAVTVNQVLIGLVTMLLAYLAATSVGYRPQGSLVPLLAVAAVSTVAVVAIRVLVAAFLTTISDWRILVCR